MFKNRLNITSKSKNCIFASFGIAVIGAGTFGAGLSFFLHGVINGFFTPPQYEFPANQTADLRKCTNALKNVEISDTVFAGSGLGLMVGGGALFFSGACGFACSVHKIISNSANQENTENASLIIQ